MCGPGGSCEPAGSAPPSSPCSAAPSCGPACSWGSGPPASPDTGTGCTRSPGGEKESCFAICSGVVYRAFQLHRPFKRAAMMLVKMSLTPLIYRFKYHIGESSG